MKPKPFVSLNHLTLPCAILLPPFFLRCSLPECGLPPKFQESDAGKPQSQAKHDTCTVLQKVPKLAASVVYHTRKERVKKI
jgi:hypothetical protein